MYDSLWNNVVCVRIWHQFIITCSNCKNDLTVSMIIWFAQRQIVSHICWFKYWTVFSILNKYDVRFDCIDKRYNKLCNDKRLLYLIPFLQKSVEHYDDVIMTMLASQITSLTVVYSIVYSGVNQRKPQSSASLAFVREIYRGPVNFPHKWPVTRKMFPFDDVIMNQWQMETTCTAQIICRYIMIRQL